jgi:hypothetical protein
MAVSSENKWRGWIKSLPGTGPLIKPPPIDAVNEDVIASVYEYT